MDFKLKDTSEGSELYFNAQGKDDHTQLDISFTVLDKHGTQHDFGFDKNELYYMAHMVNRETGFDIFNLYEIERMDAAEKQAWVESNSNKKT